MIKPKFTMLVGLPASGKSTYAKEKAEKERAVVCSSDAIRKELYGDENVQGDGNEVFNILHERVKELLSQGWDVIYDATNVKSKRRRAFLREIEKYDCIKECIIMATPYEVCLERNLKRDRFVPEEVIKKMYMAWNTPYYFEGWDTIIIHYNSKHNRCSANDFVRTVKEYNQNNSHHSLTLGEHCKKAEEYINGSFEDFSVYDVSSVSLLEAALVHDCGKPFTATYCNHKGETTSECHYYNHENTGGYNALFFDYDIAEPLEVSILVNLHMRPYQWEKSPNTEKLKNKYKNMWGEHLYNTVMMLHEADVYAH